MKLKIIALLFAVALPMWPQDTDSNLLSIVAGRLDAANTLIQVQKQVLQECYDSGGCRKEVRKHLDDLVAAMEKYEE